MNKTTTPEEEIREAWNASCEDGFDRKYTVEEWWQSAIMGDFVCSSDKAVHAFRRCWLRHAAKHAEEVRKKDHYATELQETLNSYRRQAMEGVGRINKLEAQLTAVREREEKLVEALKNIANRDLYGNGVAQYEMKRVAKEALVSHDASRAADGKEGA